MSRLIFITCLLAFASDVMEETSKGTGENKILKYCTRFIDNREYILVGENERENKF